MRFVILLSFCVLFAGCGPSKTGSTAKTPPKSVLSLTGAGGTVQIGDSIDKAQKAFPVPADGTPSEQVGLTTFGDKGWGWEKEKSNEGFEAMTKNGKVTLLMQGLGADPDRKATLAKTIAEVGEPMRKAEHKHGAIYVWESGDNARFQIHMPKMFGPFSGAFTVIGPKKELKVLGFHHDQPELFTAQLDMIDTLQPVFEKAKEKAKEKARRRAQEEAAKSKG